MAFTCTFNLNNVCEIYKSGDTVEGTILLNELALKSAKVIDIILYGQGNVAWTENEMDNDIDSDDSDKISTSYYKANEIYVDERQSLIKAGELVSGVNSFSFSLTLPMNCPSSYTNPMGSIKYNLLVVVRRKSDKKCTFAHPIRVERIYDLNLNPNHKNPLQIQKVQSFSGTNLIKGKITFILKIPYGAYTPLQLLQYTLEIDNESSSEVKGYSVVLRKQTDFTAQTPFRKQHRVHCNVIDEVYGDSCPPCSKRIVHKSFEVPAVDTTSAENNNICNSYTFMLTPFVHGVTDNVALAIPLDIGNIPIRESLEQQAVGVSASSAQEGDLPPSYQDCQPPSFAEATDKRES